MDGECRRRCFRLFRCQSLIRPQALQLLEVLSRLGPYPAAQARSWAADPSPLERVAA
jgi:hypothetical protein